MIEDRDLEWPKGGFFNDLDAKLDPSRKKIVPEATDIQEGIGRIRECSIDIL